MKGLVILIILVVAVGAVFVSTREKTQNVANAPIMTTSPSPAEEKIKINASFKIVTGNVIRSFTNPKYHNQSPDVYITSKDPTMVQVTKKGITWADFFNSLPMKLTKDCLITGDGEKLCDGQGGTLKFYLNNQEDKDLLDKEIKGDDQALITFK